MRLKLFSSVSLKIFLRRRVIDPTVPVLPAAMQDGCQPRLSTLTADE